MSRFSAKPFFTVFLVLVGFVLISSASCAYDAAATVQQIILSEDKMTARIDRAPLFIWDLEAGQRRKGEGNWGADLDIKNSGTGVKTTVCYLGVPNGGIVHYVSVTNEHGNYAAICDRPDTLGLNGTYFAVRSLPQSTARLRVSIAEHKKAPANNLRRS